MNGQEDTGEIPEVEVDGVVVPVRGEDEDEDLLEYEDNSGEEGEGEGQSGEGIVDQLNPQSNTTANAEVRQAAESLLKKQLPKVLVHYQDDKFLLFNYDDARDDDEEAYPIICENTKYNNGSCTELLASVRKFLETYYNRILFGSKEILFEIPALDLTLCEDNIYNNQITFSDIETIFRILRERSMANSEEDVPLCLEANISTRPRFVSRYNALVELTESTASLKNIKPFSNSENNPLVLDDNEPSVSNPPDSIVMDLDEDEEAGKDKKTPETVETAKENEEEEDSVMDLSLIHI